MAYFETVLFLRLETALFSRQFHFQMFMTVMNTKHIFIVAIKLNNCGFHGLAECSLTSISCYLSDCCSRGIHLQILTKLYR